MKKIAQKNNLVLILTLGILLFSLLPSLTARAQGFMQNSTPEQRAKLQTDSMKVRLPLRKEQYTPIYELNLKYARKAEPILKSTSSMITKYYKVNAIHSEKEKEFKKILTTSQYKKYLQLKDEIIKKAFSFN